MYTFPFIPFRYSKTLTIGIVILVLCLIPSSEISKIHMPITFTDAIVHFIMFMVFSWALYTDLMRKRSDYKPLKYMIITVLISLGLSTLTELLQLILIPLNRTGSFSDLTADFFGSVAGTIIAILIRRRSSVGS